MPRQNVLATIMLRYPELFAVHVNGVPQPPCCSSSIPAGWLWIVEHLCQQIVRQLGERVRDFRVEQIKEKFGVLRFYYSLHEPDHDSASAELSAQAADTLSLRSNEHAVRQSVQIIQLGHDCEYRCYQSSGSTTDVRLHEAIQGACRDAELLSAACCIHCGDTTQALLVSHATYVHTVCHAHASIADSAGVSLIDNGRRMLESISHEKSLPLRMSYWRYCSHDHVLDVMPVEDFPAPYRHKLAELPRFELPQLGVVVGVEDVVRVFNLYGDAEHTSFFAKKQDASVEVLSVNNYWQRRYGCDFPKLPSGACGAGRLT
ncbi:MAG: hypothetical protein IPO35_15245 [Uliginosibacterium sp.]|nr:hypothetical protein [Uliginosibacterium sp.]